MLFCSMVTDSGKLPQSALDLGKIIHLFDPKIDLTIYKIDPYKASDDEDLYVIGAPTIAQVLYGKSNPKEIKNLGMTLCKFFKTCEHIGIDKGICFRSGNVTNKNTEEKMPRLLSINLAINILNQSLKYKRLMTTKENEVELNPDERIVNREVHMFIKRVKDNLADVPPHIYDLVKKMAMITVNLESPSFIDDDVALVIDAVFTLKKDLSKFKDCSEDVRLLARQRVSDLFDKIPKKRSAASQDGNINILVCKKKQKKK